MLGRRRQRRRTVAITALVAVVAVAVTLVWRREDTPGTPPVPTVPTANTPTDIGCIDDPGTVNAAAKYWYSYDADGALNLDGEISASTRLGDFAKTGLSSIAANIGSYATSAIRDVAPDTSFCPTDRIVYVTFADGTELTITAWRSIAAASPQWIPSEVKFTAIDDRTFVSSGPHVVSVLAVAPDGTSVAVTAYGTNARKVFAKASGPVIETTIAPSLGTVLLTATQLAPIAAAMLAFSVAR